MRLLTLAVFVGLSFSFMATTRPGTNDDSVIAFFRPELSRDDIFQKSIIVDTSIIRFLGSKYVPLGVLALMKKSDLSPEKKEKLGVLFTMNSYGLVGCDRPISPEEKARGLTISQGAAPTRPSIN